MNTKTLSPRALNIIDQYLHFKYGSSVCSIPYFNNKTTCNRAALRAQIGKGSPQEILDETQAIGFNNQIDPNSLGNEMLKKLLVDNNLGIDCSGFAYYVLNAENDERKKGKLDKYISFTNCHGIIGRIRCSLRPIENCDVATFANDKNSRVIPIKETEPGDIITMTGIPSPIPQDNSKATKLKKNNREHILVIHQVEYQNFIPTTIHYSHAIAYPEDGPYESGVHQGEIQMVFPDKSIAEQRWIEDGKENNSNQLFIRAQKSKTEIRRLRWF